MIYQVAIIFLVTIVLSTSFHLYTNIYKPWRLCRLEKEYSGLSEQGLCPIKKESFRQKDGTYLHKITGRDFPDIRKYPWGVDIKFKTSVADKATIEKKLPGISNALKMTFVEVQELGHQHFRLICDLLPKYVRFLKETPLHSIQIGIDNHGRDILINTQKYFSIFIGGSTGDGKTTLILSLLKSWLSSVNNDADIIIFDTKGLDWNNLKYYPRTKILELNSTETLHVADQFLKNLLSEFHDSKKVVSAHNLIHYEDVRQKGVDLPLKRKVLILDEAARYLNPDASASKEEKELKQSLVNSVTAILAQCRVAGCPILVSTQRVQADEMAIPYDNFQIQVFGNISKEMDSKYRDGKFFGKRLGQGIWTIKTPELDVTRIRTLYLPHAFQPPEPEKPIDPYWYFKEGHTRALILEYALYLRDGVIDKQEAAKQFFAEFTDDEFSKVIAFLRARFGDNDRQPELVAALRANHADTGQFFKIVTITEPTSTKFLTSHKAVQIEILKTGQLEVLLIPINKVGDLDFIRSRIKG